MKLAYSFILGIMAAISAMIIEFVFISFMAGENFLDEKFFNHLTSPLIAAIIIEEALKLFFIFWATRELQERKAVIFSALAIGLGFSSIEIIFIISKLFSVQAGELLNIFGVFIIHIVTAGFIGYILAVSRNIFWAGIMAFALAVLLHLGYNSLVIYNFPLAYLYAFLALLTVVFYFLSKKVISKID
ncbi:MAG: PrsW family glutamic-type intramembrane protease [Candidatus Moranbacteria bacterium]|nr:PrsW family glutamic-type intramembrane protease [Candidatus Moranbacteria bacterium]